MESCTWRLVSSEFFDTSAFLLYSPSPNLDIAVVGSWQACTMHKVSPTAKIFISVSVCGSPQLNISVDQRIISVARPPRGREHLPRRLHLQFCIASQGTAASLLLALSTFPPSLLVRVRTLLQDYINPSLIVIYSKINHHQESKMIK
jgi:hypothetical protein